MPAQARGFCQKHYTESRRKVLKEGMLVENDFVRMKDMRSAGWGRREAARELGYVFGIVRVAYEYETYGEYVRGGGKRKPKVREDNIYAWLKQKRVDNFWKE